MFLLALKRYFKSSVILLGTILYIVVLYLMLPVHRATGIEELSNATLTTQTFSFFFFLIISYEYFYQIQKSKLEEIVKTTSRGESYDKFFGVILFMLLNLILYLVFLVSSFVSTVKVMNTVNFNWLWHLAKTFSVYHFLTYFLGIIIGMLISEISSRLRGFFTLIIVFSFFSRVLYPVMMQSVNFSEKWTHIVDVFGIMNRNYTIFCDLVYNYTTENVNFQRIFFWIFLTISIYCVVHYRERRKIVTCVMWGVTSILFLCYIQPSGERYVYGDWGTYMEEQQYYSLVYEDAKNKDCIGRKYKKHDFKIVRYEATLTPKRTLKARVDVFVDKTKLDYYDFTLYHGYEIERVTDEKGETLSFEQNIDHVRIQTNKKHCIKKIHFEYQGYSRKYVSTEQTMYLAGNFPYLPNAGWNEYMIEPNENEWQIGCNLKGAMYQSEYDIQISMKLPVYSNLKRDKRGHFVGKTEGATFLASPFVAKKKLKNCTLYYPVLSRLYWNDRIKETMKQYEEAIETVKKSQRDKEQEIHVFAMSGVMDPEITWYVAMDQFIASASNIEELYSYYKETGCTIDHTKWDQEESK